MKTEEGQDPQTLVEFTSAKCIKGKGNLQTFRATAKRGGWRMSVNIFRTRASQVPLEYGSDGDADFNIDGPEGSFSNLNRPPDAPPGGGFIAFNRKKTRMGIGFQPMFNSDFSGSIDVAGGLKCKYPKKKRRRR